MIVLMALFLIWSLILQFDEILQGQQRPPLFVAQYLTSYFYRCKPCFVLTAWSAGFELPEEVATHPVISTLEDAANDLITWSNVSFSSTLVVPVRGLHLPGHLLVQRRAI